MTSIGGYFELELAIQKEFHSKAIKLNTARNALEYILRLKNISKIYLPFYTCGVLLQPIIKLKVKCEFYSINSNFEVSDDFDFRQIKDTEAFLYTNYFGLKNNYVKNLKGKAKNLIVDNAQAFFAAPNTGIDTFYSVRKFFGVPDGAYLYTEGVLPETIERAQSYSRFEHLLRRIDVDAEDGYEAFLKNENSLNSGKLLRMSKLTETVLRTIDYSDVANKRRSNFQFLEDALQNMNQLKFRLTKESVLMVYPFYCHDKRLKKKLIGKKIYVPTYWPNVLTWVKNNSIEYNYVENIIHLPIDQRYGEKELSKILKIVMH